MKNELLKELKRLKPAENLIDKEDKYWIGYKKALKDVNKLVKKLNIHGVIKSVCKNCGDESERDFCSLSCNAEYNRKHKTVL